MRSFIVILAVSTLAGCINLRPLVRGYSITPSTETKSLVMDAKRRAIIGVPNPHPRNMVKMDPGEVERMTFLCAEPSPDALATISSALTLSSGSNKETLRVAFSEAAKQLGRRNATIQLLRDGLYRQCEAFLNGIVDDATYSWIANKYVNAMVVLLAIEEITPDPAEDETEGPAKGKGKQEDDNSEDTEGQPTIPDPLANKPEVKAQARHRNSGVSKEVAQAVTNMAEMFLSSDSLNYCLHMTRFYGSDTYFDNMCKGVITRTYSRVPEKAQVRQDPVPSQEDLDEIYKQGE